MVRICLFVFLWVLMGAEAAKAQPMYRPYDGGGNWFGLDTWEVSTDGGATWSFPSSTQGYPGQYSFSSGSSVTIGKGESILMSWTSLPYAISSLTITGASGSGNGARLGVSSSATLNFPIMVNDYGCIDFGDQPGTRLLSLSSYDVTICATTPESILGVTAAPAPTYKRYFLTDGIGTLKKTVASSGMTIFEVGTPSYYNPVSISPVSGYTQDVIGVRVVNSTPSLADTTQALHLLWKIDELVPGGSAALITLRWNANQEGTRFTRNSSGVLGTSNGGLWTSASITGVPDGCCGSYEATSTSAVSPLGYFTIANSVSALPIQLVNFAVISVTPSAVKLQWETASEIENYGFVVYRCATQVGVYSPVSALIQGHGTTLTPQSYTWTDNAPSVATTFYRLRQYDMDNSNMDFGPIQVTVPTASEVIENSGAPRELKLLQNYPNPFNPKTVVSCQLPAVSMVRLVVYDLLGREIAVLMDEQKAPGKYQLEFDGTKFSSGVYVYRLIAGGYVESKRMILLK
jgi:hypothetical protein